MKSVIKINFVDFWPGFKKEDNYFTNLLSGHYQIELTDKPDFLFYSVYGHEVYKVIDGAEFLNL